MKDISRIVELAERLGGALAEHTRCQELKEAAKELRGDEEALKLEREYDEAARLLQENAAAGRPLEPEDKRKEASLREKVAAHPAIQRYVRSQADFQELMIRVHKSIEEQIDK